jgi:integrase
VYFTESTTDEAQVDTILTKLLRRADEQRSPGSAVTLGYAINEWIRVSELEEARGTPTRATSTAPSGRPSAEPWSTRSTRAPLENFYADLRRCRKLCDRKPFIDKHATTGDHDCVAEQCQPHLCKPMAASTIRQLYAIISGTLSAAERWTGLPPTRPVPPSAPNKSPHSPIPRRQRKPRS